MELPEDLPAELLWHIVKFLTHPAADLVKERLRCHNVSMDSRMPFHEFHFRNLAYDYDFLQAECQAEMLPEFFLDHFETS